MQRLNVSGAIARLPNFPGVFDRLRAWTTRRGALSVDQRLLFYSRLARLLRSRRRTVADALDILYAQETADGVKLTPYAMQIDGWRQAIRRGKGGQGQHGLLAQAMHGAVPPIEQAVLMAGENSDMVSSLDGIIKMLRVQQSVRRGIRKALLMPKIARWMMLAVIVGTNFLVLPNIAISAPVSSWTGIAGLFAATVGFIAEGWPIFLVIGILAGPVMARVRDQWHGPARETADRYLPSFRLHRVSEGAGVLFALAALVRASLPEDHALKTIIAIVSPYTRAQLVDVYDAQRAGKGAQLGQSWRRSNPRWPNRDIVFDLDTMEPTEDVPLAAQITEVANTALSDIEDELKRFEVKAQASALIMIGLFMMIFIASFVSVVISQMPSLNIIR